MSDSSIQVLDFTALPEPSDTVVMAAQTADAREDALGKLGFTQAVQRAAVEAEAHFKAWCAQLELAHDGLDEGSVDNLLAGELARVRKAS